MKRFDVFASRSSALLLNVQTDWGPPLATRIIVPLLPTGSMPTLGSMTPTFTVQGRTVIMATPLMASAEMRRLGHPVANLAAHQDAITLALDLLLTGF